MARFDAVVFDLDGLLLDTERVALDTGVAALAAIGHPVPEAVMQRLIGLDAEAGHAILTEWLQRDIPQADIFDPWNDAFEAALARGVPLRPRAAEALDHLDRAGPPRAVATNSLTEAAHWKIDRSDLAGRFEVIVGRDLAGGAKPEPHVYLHAASLLGIDPTRCLALEDSDVGVRSARAAGMTVVQIPDILPSKDKAADFEAPDLMAALTWAGLA